MQFRLDKQTASFLLGIISRPRILPFGDMQPNFKPYTASDEPGARQLIVLKRWAEDKLLDSLETAEKENKKEEEIIFEGGLKKPYIDRLLHALTHYKPMGMLVQCAEPYWKLKDALDGKKYEEDDPTEDGPAEDGPAEDGLEDTE